MGSLTNEFLLETALNIVSSEKSTHFQCAVSIDQNVVNQMISTVSVLI